MTITSSLPPAHPQRTALHNEIHARPPQGLRAPLAISHVVMACGADQRTASREHLAALLRDHHLPGPDAESTHLRTELAGFGLRWEMHTEFVTWTFLRPFDASGFGQRSPDAAIGSVPQDWLARLPGQMLAGLHLWVLPTREMELSALLRHVFNEETLVGSAVVQGQGEVYTDFAMHADGFSRMVLLAGQVGARRLGRLVQQLLEIDTYRMTALLGLPAARQASSVLGYAERELAELAESIRLAARDQERVLLDRLTRLAGKVESEYAATHSRFSASAAYFELIDRRIADIGETRIDGLQTIGQFMERRLSPARSTCAWATRRQDALSERVSRMSSLLRTRVEIEQQQSSQEVLDAMNRRQGLQLQLQSTVEGLSVAAITYYIVGLVSYLAKAAHAIGWPWSAESTAACAIPVVALAVWASLRRLHRKVFSA